MATNGKHKKPIVLGPIAWENALMALIGDEITKGVPEADIIAALEKCKIGLIMAHTVSTVERRAKKKN